jgi:dinuclear metal center YbgI/SA1388 family protein
MTTTDLDLYFRTFLDIEGFVSTDNSLNGLQVDKGGGPVAKIAFAVDACMESFRRAKEAGADMLFVHHGLFWGKPLALTGTHRERLRFLLDNDIALYACHLPLDAAPEVGNNAVLARLLGIETPEPFCDHRGKTIAYKGKLAKPLSADEAARKIAFMDRPPTAVYPFGKALSETAAVVSGGAPFEVLQAVDAGVDLYVTGETGHSIYHSIIEAKINMVAGGHYNTEVWGVRAVMDRVKKELSLETEFIDLPTGL